MKITKEFIMQLNPCASGVDFQIEDGYFADVPPEGCECSHCIINGTIDGVLWVMVNHEDLRVCLIDALRAVTSTLPDNTGQPGSNPKVVINNLLDSAEQLSKLELACRMYIQRVGDIDALRQALITETDKLS